MLCVVQGFLLESEYAGDNGHPRMSWINPTSAANSVLVKGDILLEINGKPTKSHTQAAKTIAALKGDVVLKLLAQKPRGGMTTIEAIEAAGGVNAGETATKIQSWVRGHQSRKAMPKRKEAERDAATAKEAATTNAELDAAAAKVQSLTRGRHSRKKMDSAHHSRKKIVSAPDAPPAEQEEMGTEELEAVAQDGSKHHRRRSVKTTEEHRHHHRTKPEDFGAEAQLAELSLAEASTPSRHKHRRRSTRKREELSGEAEGAEEATQPT